MAGKDNSSETLAKGLLILDIFGDDDVGYTLSQLSRQTGINKTSIYRYVNTFCELGFLKRDERTGLYRLGVRMLALAHAMLEKSELERAVKVQVDDAHERHGVHIDVGILSGDSIYLIYRRESQDTKAFRSFSYGSEPHCLAAGKAALAFMDRDELDALVDRLEFSPKTERTITTSAELLADLNESAERGYTRNREEFVPGLIAIGAPLYSLRTGKVVGGVSFDSSTDRYSMEEFELRYAGYLVELAKKISAVVSW
jgi:IclR family pca regulon transcriptional regulator